MSLTPILKDLVIEGVLLARMRKRAEAKLAGLGFYALAGLLGSIGFLFLIYALYLALLMLYTPLVAALWTGGVLIAFGVILMFVGSLISKRRLKRAKSQDQNLIAMAMAMLGSVDREIGSPVKSNPKTSLLVAGLAGLFAGGFLK